MTLSPGDRFSRHHALTPDEVRAFATASGDTNPLHHDEALAAQSRYQGLIASGTHTSALLLGLTASHFSARGPVVGLGFSVKFIRAVGATEHILLEWVVTRVTPYERGPGQRVAMEGRLLDSQGRPCVLATGEVLVDGAQY